MTSRVADVLRASLWDKTPRDHWQSEGDFRRRRFVTVGVLLVGALVLAVSLRIKPGSAAFYPATLALAAVWTVGAFASGPLHLGRIGWGRAPRLHSDDPDHPGADLEDSGRTSVSTRRPVVVPVLLGLGLAGVFVVGALVVREIPPLAHQVRQVLSHANQGSGVLLLVITVLNGIAEELFFRGAVYAAARNRQVLITTITYGVATAATGNVMLSFAALVLGLVVGLERRASGGILAPVLTHITWSVVMLYALPAIFGLG